MNPKAAALCFAVLDGGVILFQLLLALGMPWGHLALGGQYPGRLPDEIRVAEVIQALVLAGFGAVVLGRAGWLRLRWNPGWLVWLVVGLMSLSALMNWLSPSEPERYLWGPVATLMFGLALLVAVRGRSAPKN